MKDEKIKVYVNDQLKELSFDEIENVAGGAGSGWTCEAVCPIRCGFVKVFDNWDDCFMYVAETKKCPGCGYDEYKLMIKTKG